MHFNGFDVFYSQCFHHHAWATITAIFRVVFLLQKKGTNVFTRNSGCNMLVKTL
jgi:hypothetical protein